MDDLPEGRGADGLFESRLYGGNFLVRTEYRSVPETCLDQLRVGRERSLNGNGPLVVWEFEPSRYEQVRQLSYASF